MPELPEVETTTKGINTKCRGLRIVDVWTDLSSTLPMHANQIKNRHFFKIFKDRVAEKIIDKAERRGKNILIHLKNSPNSKDKDLTIVIHMKMTGHIMYGHYELLGKKKQKEHSGWTWWPKEKSLQDPFNRHIHFVLTFSNGANLVMSDSRKFAKVSFFENSDDIESTKLSVLGPDALDKDLNEKTFKNLFQKRKTAPIKSALLDQELVTGIGNIYSDEALWRASIHPLRKVESITNQEWKKLYKELVPLLEEGIKFGGDSTSDYRNIDGEPGNFQKRHQVYRRLNKPCLKKGCKGEITRLNIGGRSSHFCPKHQR